MTTILRFAYIRVAESRERFAAVSTASTLMSNLIPVYVRFAISTGNFIKESLLSFIKLPVETAHLCGTQTGAILLVLRV